MKLGIHYSRFPGATPADIAPTLEATARAAEEGGCALFTLMDHWFQMEQLGGPELPMLEGYTGLGYVAAVTEKMELGLLVTGVTYRHPGLLAKIATTLDVLSRGRALLGLGAAWYEREHDGLGVPYPPLGERFERLEETLQICLQMFDPSQNGPYAGKHYQLAETLNDPPPVRRPRPRVMIGGMGERKTLRLVAQYADACNLFDAGAEKLAHKIAVLDQHCADQGRDPSEVQRTVLTSSERVDDREAFLARMAEYAALGIDHVSVSPPAEDPAGWTAAVCADVLPRLAEL
jgi:F420-dependent oxidoreductase-like protein